MSVQKKIKQKILQEINTEIDKLYDSVQQRFILSDADHDLIIKELNRLKDQFYLISTQSKLS